MLAERGNEKKENTIHNCGTPLFNMLFDLFPYSFPCLPL